MNNQMNKIDCIQQVCAVGGSSSKHSEVLIRFLTLQIEGKLCILPVYTKQAEDGTWY